MPEPRRYCERRNQLAESLVDLAVRISIAAVEMAVGAGASGNESFLKAKAEVEHLRNELESLTADLSHHRLNHGC